MADATRPDAARAAVRVPGVYFEHGWGGAQPEPGTGIPAFIGLAAHPRAARAAASACPVLQRWEQFDQVLRDIPADGYLRYAVKGFFDNGGAHCVVVPASADPHDPAAVVAALMAPLGPGGVLEDLGLVDLVCVPDLMMLAGAGMAAAVCDVQNTVLDHCRRMGNRFAILDALPEAGNPGSRGDAAPPVGMALRHWETLVSGNGALYFPWIRVRPLAPAANAAARARQHAIALEETIAVPPCGHVAGVYARADRRAGPHQAPANELVHGVARLALDLSDAQYGALNDKGVNCLRSVPGRGIRVWGARTVSGDPLWRYVNVRRLFLTFARWVEHNCADLVFEPNNAELWERHAQRLREYCRALFDRGALAGARPADAFHVKCDAESNPPASIEAGNVVAEVALAPLVPAEFVVVRITQNAGGLAVGIPSGIE